LFAHRNKQIELESKLRTNMFIDLIVYFFHSQQSGRATCSRTAAPARSTHIAAWRRADCDPSRITDRIITETLLVNLSNET